MKINYFFKIKIPMAFIRPAPTAPRRYIFNYAHRSVGLSAFFLSGILNIICYNSWDNQLKIVLILKLLRYFWAFVYQEQTLVKMDGE
jgi:hypothetical protein